MMQRTLKKKMYVCDKTKKEVEKQEETISKNEQE